MVVREKVGDAGGKCFGFAGAGRGKDLKYGGGRSDCCMLSSIELGEHWLHEG